MSTTFAVDDTTAKGFREAVEKKFGRYGAIKEQVRIAIEERTKELLKNE